MKFVVQLDYNKKQLALTWKFIRHVSCFKKISLWFVGETKDIYFLTDTFLEDEVGPNTPTNTGIYW